MKNESFKKTGSRVTALLLAVLLMVQALPVVSASGAGVPDTGSVTVEPAGKGKVLPEYIFSDGWNAEYDVLYHLADEKYTYSGQEVSFPDEATVKVGETSYPIKNAVTSVSAVMENGKPVVTFQNLKTPVGGISGEWNSNFAGTFAIHGKVNGQPITPADVNSISNVKLIVEADVSGSYTFTDGRIYEAANEYSGGHDFGNGVVTSREFGYLPEVTVTVEVPSTPPTPPEPSTPPAPPEPSTPPTPPEPSTPPAPPVPDAPFTAKIGDRTLDVAEITNSADSCSATHTYEIKVPDTQKDQQVAIDGLKDYTYRAVAGDNACDGNLEAWSGSAAVNEFGYHFHADQGYNPDYQDIHIVFSLFHEEAPKAPIQATLGQQELQIDVIPPETEYGPTGLVIHVPSPFAKSVTLHGVKGWMYLEKNITTGQLFTIETNDWDTEVLGAGEFFMLYNWLDGYRVTFQVADAAEANILLNAQMNGEFLLPPETNGQIAPGLAKTLGYAYGKDITETDVTALDALVKMHQIKYPGEDVKQYLALNEQGFITKVFGAETGAVGFMVNGTMPNTAIHATVLSEGDTVDFFNYQDTANWSDKVVWLEQNGQKHTQFKAAVGVPLTLTVKSADYSGKVTPVSGVQLATVDADGKITPMEGVTDRNGTISVTFPQADSYTVTVISSNETKVVMPVAHITVSGDVVILSVEARAAGQGDFLPATVIPLAPDASQTVKDLLDTAARQFNLDVVYTENGGLQSINGLSSSEGGWRYFVNGETATESISERKAVAGDVIRIRFAVTAAADELDAPLFQYLEKLVAEAKNLLRFAYTQESKQTLQAAVNAADAVLSDPANNSFEDDKELLLSQHISAINEGIAQLVPEETAKDPSIPDDFQNDLWLQYDYKEMNVGETASIYPRRVPQIISDPIQNIVTRPVFRFEIVKGDSITLSENATREKTQVTAVKDGVSIVKVTYDAEGEFGACSPINEAYAVFNVGSTGTLQISTSLSQIRSYDTVYYTGTDTVAYPFTVSAPGAAKVEVTCNDLPVAANTDGTYTANLENRSNVLGISATDAQGNITRYYRVVDARKIQVIVDNKTSPGQPFKINDTARVSFRGITMPVYKLATIYNPCFGAENPVTHVTYQNEQLGELTGYCDQYNIAAKNSFEITFTEAGDYHFTDGRVFCAWWGDDLGSDKNKEGSGKPGFGAPIVQDIFSWMPDFTIHVANEFSDNVPVTGIQLNRAELTLSEGESFQLTATVQPDNATNRNFVWSCDDPTGFFLTLDKNTGKITAKNACTPEQPMVTVTATTEDGAKAASCKVVVKAVPHNITVENGTANPSSAARKTVVTIRANQAPAGKQFDHWEVIRGTIYLTNSNQAETRFVMPDTDVALKAVYTTVKTPNRDPGGESHSFSDKSEKYTRQESNMVDAEIVDGMVSAEALAKIQGKDKNLRMTGKLEDGREFTWIINGMDIQKAVPLKFGMSRNGRFEEDIHKLAEEYEIFRFMEEGSFPGPMLVEMPTDLEDGSYLLMRYNDAERCAEKVSKVEVTDGFFSFIADKSGEYFLTKRASSKTVTELETQADAPEDTTAPTTVTTPTAENSTAPQKSIAPTVILVSVIVIGAVCGGVWLGVRYRKEKKHD